MSNEQQHSLYERAIRYLKQSTLHIVSFTALVIVHNAVANPGSLQMPVILFLSVMALIFTASLQVNYFNKAMSIHSYHSATLAESTNKSSKRLALFNTLRLACMYGSNIILTSFSAAYVLFAPSNITVILAGFAIYHCLHSLRDYFSDRNALEFINRYFKITHDYNPDRKIMTSSFTFDDPNDFRKIAHSLSDEIKEKHHLTCQIAQISNEKLEVETGIISNEVMYQPVRIISRTNPEQQYWIEYSNLIHANNIHVLSKDFIITQNQDDATQDKIQQIRDIIASTSRKLADIRKLQSQLRTLCFSESMLTYRQAISTTNEECVPEQVTTAPQGEIAHNETLNQLLEHKNRWLDLCREENIDIQNTNPSPDTPSDQRTAARCAITMQPATIPLRVHLTDNYNGRGETFHCDALSLLKWLDSDPSGTDASTDMDLQEINALLSNQENQIPLMSKHQIKTVQENISPDLPSNPIALLLKYQPEDNIQALDLLLSSHYLKCRIHDRDLLTTLSDNDRRYFSLSEYLHEHDLHEHYALIVSKCYSSDTSMGSKMNDFAQDDNNEGALLNKRWPMHRYLMISHETEMQIAIDEEEVVFQTEYADRVIRNVLQPAMDKIKSQMDDEQDY